MKKVKAPFRIGELINITMLSGEVIQGEYMGGSCSSGCLDTYVTLGQHDKTVFVYLSGILSLCPVVAPHKKKSRKKKK